MDNYGLEGEGMAGRKRRNTCLIVGLGFVAACLCAVVILGGGGYYLYSTGKLSLGDVLGFVGMGPGEVHVSNLSDGILYVEMTYIDEETGEKRTAEELEMAPFDIRILTDLTPREYQITISSEFEMPPGGSCRLYLGGGDTVSLVAVPEGVIVYREGDSVSTGEEINLLTSLVCQGE